MSHNTAIVDLVRDALSDPSLRDEFRAIVSEDDSDASETAHQNESLIDVHRPGGCSA